MNRNQQIRHFIQEKSDLFWYIAEEKNPFISDEFLVETILNYGNSDDVRKLIDLMGIKKVAAIFEKQTQKDRTNYFPPVINYFTLYFARNAR